MAEEKNKGGNANSGKNNTNKSNDQSRNYSNNIGESNAKQEQLRKAMEVTPKPKPKDGGGKK